MRTAQNMRALHCVVHIPESVTRVPLLQQLVSIAMPRQPLAPASHAVTMTITSHSVTQCLLIAAGKDIHI